MPAPFNIHHNHGCPPWVTPKGGNGKYHAAVTLKWKSVGGAGPFTLKFEEMSSGHRVPWNSLFSNIEPSWPVDECEGDWSASQYGSFKYNVVMEGDEDNPLDPMLVFDSVVRSWSTKSLVSIAVIAAVVGLLIGRVL